MFKQLPEERIVFIANSIHNDRQLDPAYISSFSAAAGLILAWLKHLVVAYCGREKFRDVHVMSDDEEEPVREDPTARIKPFQSTKYTYGIRKKTKQEIEQETKAIAEEEQEEERQRRSDMEELFFSPNSGPVKQLNSDLYKSPFDASNFMKELRSHKHHTGLPQVYKQYKEAIRKRTMDRGRFLRSKQMVFGRREDPYHDPSSMLMPQKSVLSYNSQNKMRASSIDGS